MNRYFLDENLIGILLKTDDVKLIDLTFKKYESTVYGVILGEIEEYAKNNGINSEELLAKFDTEKVDIAGLDENLFKMFSDASLVQKIMDDVNFTTKAIVNTLMEGADAEVLQKVKTYVDAKNTELELSKKRAINNVKNAFEEELDIFISKNPGLIEEISPEADRTEVQNNTSDQPPAVNADIPTELPKPEPAPSMSQPEPMAQELVQQPEPVPAMSQPEPAKPEPTPVMNEPQTQQAEQIAANADNQATQPEPAPVAAKPEPSASAALEALVGQIPPENQQPQAEPSMNLGGKITNS